MSALSVGTLLNPLNSSMIAVALLTLRHSFGLTVITVTWVITAFYLASAAGQPLMGRLGDRFGPRRLFVFGMALVILVCAATPFSPSFFFVCLGRVFLAIGTATAFPSAVALLHPITAGSGLSSPRLLGRIQMANTAGAAIGPVVGGLLVTSLGWQAIFWINVPLAAVALLGVRVTVPADAPRPSKRVSELIAESDVPGIISFSTALVALLVFLLNVTDLRAWPLLAVAAGMTFLFLRRERRTPLPFIDVRMLAQNRRLLLVYGTFALFTLVYYCAFFGLPQFLEEHGGYPANVTGMLMLPLAALNVLLTPLAARFIERRGVRTAFLIGGTWLIGSSALMAALSWSTAPLVPLIVAAAMGLPYCLVSIAMSQALFTSAGEQSAGVATGIFQTSRYIGAILATTVLGLALSGGTTPGNWLIVCGVAVVLSGILLALLSRWRPLSPRA